MPEPRRYTGLVWRGLLVLLVATSVYAGELTTSSIVKTIRFHPEGEPARIGLRVLSRLGEPGWIALAGVVGEYRKSHPPLARAAATAFAEGPEKERDHSPEEYRESMMTNVSLHRDIVAALEDQTPT